MARVVNDRDQSAALAALLDQYGRDDSGMAPDDAPQVSSYPGGDAATRGEEQRNIIDKMGGQGPAGSGDPSIPHAPMQQAPGQQGMIQVPANLAHAGMAALMQQASLNSIGKSRGADGNNQYDVRGGFPRNPGDLEGAEVEADEDVGHNRGPDFPSEDMDEDPTMNQIRRRVSPDRKPAKR